MFSLFLTVCLVSPTGTSMMFEVCPHSFTGCFAKFNAGFSQRIHSDLGVVCFCFVSKFKAL